MTFTHDPTVRGFASDNYSGVHPEVLAAIAAANGGHQIAYGEDVYTTQATQSNGVFATLPDGVADQLREQFHFYDWDAARNEVRWMCSFDTQEADVDAFVAELARLTTA